MHNYTRKIERKQQLMERELGAKLAYSDLWGIFEANSGCSHHIKSGKILIDRKTSQKLRSLFKIPSGSQDDISDFL